MLARDKGDRAALNTSRAITRQLRAGGHAEVGKLLAVLFTVLFLLLDRLDDRPVEFLAEQGVHIDF